MSTEDLTYETKYYLLPIYKNQSAIFTILDLPAYLSNSYFINGIHYSVKKSVPILYNFVKTELHNQTTTAISAAEHSFTDK